MRFKRFLVLLTLCALAGAVGAESWYDAPDTASGVTIHHDFADRFGEAVESNSLSAMASQQERCGNVNLPGVFLHPRDTGDAVLRYEDVTIPAIPGRRAFLVFRVGVRDGIPWETKAANKPNGVRFIIHVDGEEVFNEDALGSYWRGRAVDLTPWAGQQVAVELRTNAIDRHTSYDWGVFGEPMVASLPADATDVASLAPDTVGLMLAEVACTAPGDVTVSAGAVSERVSLQAGRSWIPLTFDGTDAPTLTAASGAATLTGYLAAPYESTLTYPEVAVASPLLTVGRPFNVLFATKNTGRGTHAQDTRVSIEFDGRVSLAPGQPSAQDLRRLQPNEGETLAWRECQATAPGPCVIRVGPVSQECHVFPEEQATAHAHSETPTADASPNAAVFGTVSNGRSRLTFVTDDSGDAYAIGEAWDGSAWQRAASLYPLAQLTVQDAQGRAQTARFQLDGVAADGTTLTVKAKMVGAHRESWPVRLVFDADAEARIRMQAELVGQRPCDVLAFHGPTVLAGDRAFGVEKDFAIFPGLEYLEWDEPSSSERDLAFPLSDRRVPAIHKIATPLMAVQGRGALVGLLWDAKQEWADDEPYPAARFMAPEFESGHQHIHMGLFAPSVGDYVAENTYLAKTPYELLRGGRIRLASTLVLDHEDRYPADSVVFGPHRGGLVLQAMQHWFDEYGLIKPSEQPRPWDEERALCRDAYANAVWNDDPPAWLHCAGWTPGLHVGQATPQLIDLQAGVDADTERAVMDRVSRAIDRAVREQGPHYLWTHAGCHIMLGELPYLVGYLPESMNDLRANALGRLRAKGDAPWVWHAHSEKHATLGIDGDHTLGQASAPSMICLRAARLTGDPELAAMALEAMKQMEQYEVPRGAQMWECPLYQPDILGSAQAIRAYCEAYRLTGDLAYLEQARYWAWTGLPFIYFWEMEGYPTMNHNVISVIGSTFYRHSWLGLPVVWCGLVYAYALQDFAQYDDSFPWAQVAQGITTSAMWQQYPDGTSKGCYPDSWNMVKNTPNPADINPENILVNEFRLRGQSPEIRFARIEGGDTPVLLNSAADIVATKGSLADKAIEFTVRSGRETYSLLAPVPKPATVTGVGEPVADSTALRTVPTGWLYDAELQGLVVKHTGEATCTVRW
ncbi:MAG: hypothetical protein GY851_02490 [bacterium]|nr:hypothetical protein [bacterium]